MRTHTVNRTAGLAVLGRRLGTDDEQVAVLAEQGAAPVDGRGQADRGERRVVVGVLAVFDVFGGQVQVVALDLEVGCEARNGLFGYAGAAAGGVV